MAYNPLTPGKLIAFSASYVPVRTLLNFLVASQGTAFQTQAGRDSFRESLSALPSSVVDINSRFPDAGFYAFLNGPVLRPIFVSLLSSTDTRNRVIEVVDPSNPTTAESLNAVKRTDDASTAARAEIDNLIESISKGFDVYDRASFEAAFSVVWSEATTSKA
nr:coat protein [Cucumber green mottle mosaic virus]